jgi:hypothetical protein
MVQPKANLIELSLATPTEQPKAIPDTEGEDSKDHRKETPMGKPLAQEMEYLMDSSTGQSKLEGYTVGTMVLASIDKN